MARTYLSGDNSRGSEVTGANAKYAHLRGWNAGVYVTAGRTEDDRDEFTVTMTSGSNGGGGTITLGTVTDTPDGPRWGPARLPAGTMVPAGPAADPVVFGEPQICDPGYRE